MPRKCGPPGMNVALNLGSSPLLVVLLDVAMPRLDGLEVCRRLKRDPRHRLVPIVILTAQTDRATRLGGLAAGADDFLTKPFDDEEVKVRSRSLLRERALNQRLDGAEAVILALARAVEARDLYTVHHAERVGNQRDRAARNSCSGESHRLERRALDHADLFGRALTMRILLNEDDPLNTASFRAVLEHAGHGATGETSGPLGDGTGHSASRTSLRVDR